MDETLALRINRIIQMKNLTDSDKVDRINWAIKSSFDGKGEFSETNSYLVIAVGAFVGAALGTGVALALL